MKEDKRLDKFGVLITSHPKQQKFWRQTFDSWVGYPHYMLMGYDDDNWDGVPIDQFMPPVKETFLTNYKAGALGHFRGELEQLQIGGKILADRGMEWFYKSAADNTCYRWRNLTKFFNVLRGYDLVICGTTQMFGKVSVLNKCMELWQPKLKSGGAELYMYSQIREFDFKVRYEKVPLWEKQLGLIHIQGEVALNQDTNVMRTWINGHKWTPDFQHRDLTKPRLEYFKDVELIYPDENTLPEDKETR